MWQQREEGVLLFNNRGKKGQEGCAYLCLVAEGRREKEVVSFCVWHQKDEENRRTSVCHIGWRPEQGSVDVFVTWKETTGRMCVYACGSRAWKKEVRCV